MELGEKLATKTYERIFHYSGTHMLDMELNTLKEEVLSQIDSLNDLAQKRLFIYELLARIKEEKLQDANKQQIKYGQVLMDTYSQILDIYAWLNKVLLSLKNQNIHKGKNQTDVKEKVWKGQISQLEHLANSLSMSNLIQEEDRQLFIKLFSGEDSHRIKWLGSNTLLVYFLVRLVEENYLFRDLPFSTFIASCFLSKKGTLIDNIKQTKQNIGQNKKALPKGSEVIDIIITPLKSFT